MSSPQNEIAKKFQALHNPSDTLIICNAHDGGSAKIVAQHPRAKAIASGSYAVAAVQGLADDELSLEQNIHGVKPIIAAAVAAGKPVSIDIRDGYGDRLEEIMTAIIKLGAVGCNLEDFNNETKSFYTEEEAAARVKRAMKVASDLGVPNFCVNARTDVLFLPDATIDDAVKRGKAYLAAGATTVFVWGGPGGRGLRDHEIKTLVAELDGMVNVIHLPRPGKLSLSEIRSLGVARTSMGHMPYVAALTAFEQLADTIPA
ncbi:hypothetical protein GYMLUDRAFT_83377 [Collybiopsis luxurians FD-317 M1]|uniref:Uncharacterized protein n=1 Tax=Collybiopsis luxurians FD-317 M1 TaxID=944289 RepID=A0A0D0D3W9_9AGAR|nr:hypothetical protein GYMLUDRAFT_83377 [Collybiopsis luxurians FD-317 M1]